MEWYTAMKEHSHKDYQHTKMLLSLFHYFKYFLNTSKFFYEVHIYFFSKIFIIKGKRPKTSVWEQCKTDLI